MNESVPRSSDNEFDGSDFSNNLFSDLAPLLTLFGEQVTKQFLSQAMGYGDDVLLAMAPLGIITCVISAIRVGGRKWLKALVGRARESRATAEMEIMSSTSDAVCELWSGAEIVRERGMPRTKEFIYLPVDAKAALAEWRASRIVYDLRTACEERLMQITKSTRKIPWRRQSDGTSLIDDRTRAVEYAKRLMQQAPNLTLNVTKAITSPIETWTFAVLGITIQLAVLVVASLVTYHWGLGQSGYSIVEYGFPLFLIGSVLLCGGIFICSYIIESVTEETDFELVENKKRTKVVRLQCACTVGDQHFGSYAIMNEEGNTTIRTSRINDSPDFSLLSVVATCLSLGGYILQFVGLRAMHWSVAITVLGATLIMACVRAYVRRGLAADPQVVKLHEGHELSWMALDSVGLQSFELGTATIGENTVPGEFGFDDDTTAVASALASKAVEVRKELQQLVPWQDEFMNIAQQLADAINKTLQCVLEDEDFNKDEELSSLLLFETGDAQKLAADVAGGTRADLSTVPLTCRFLTPIQRKEKVDAYTAELNSKFRRRRLARIRKLTEGADIVEVVEEESDDEESADEVEYSWLGPSLLTPLIAALTPGPLEATHRRPEGYVKWLETDWFRQHWDRIEEPASTGEAKSPPGFCLYAFQHICQVFGASFKWEAEVKLSGTNINDSKTLRYGFLARYITQRSEDDEGPGDFDRPPGATWSIDVGSLAAVLSLWTLTVETKLRADPRPYQFIRLLGCGWQVPVPAEASVNAALGDGSDMSEILQWVKATSEKSHEKEEEDLAAELMDNSDGQSQDDNRAEPESQTAPSDLPEPAEDAGPRGAVYENERRETETETEGSWGLWMTDRDLKKVATAAEEIENTNGCSSPPDQPGAANGDENPSDLMPREYKAADFYGVWIERRTPATTMHTTDINFDTQYVFGTAFWSRSRELRVHALEAEEMMNTQSPGPGIPTTAHNAASSALSTHSHNISADNRHKSVLLSYMQPPNAKGPNRKAISALLDQQKAVISNNSLARLCAQEIFSSFMLQIVATIKGLIGYTRRRTPLRGDHAGTLRWRHSTLAKLAAIVCDSKLVADEEEAYMLVVPAFHAYGLLPTEPPPPEHSETGPSSYPSFSYDDSPGSESLDRHSTRSSV